MNATTETTKEAGSPASRPASSNATMKNLIEIADRFKAELAAEYSLPEVAAAKFGAVKEHASNGRIWFHAETGHIEVSPTGQMAGIVNHMTVNVSVGSDGTSTRGVLKYSYTHHSLGSNGSEQCFEIVVEDRYGRGAEYLGKVSERLAYAYLQKLHERSNSRELNAVAEAAAKVAATAYLSPREVEKRGDLADCDVRDVHPELIANLKAAVGALAAARKGDA